MTQENKTPNDQRDDTYMELFSALIGAVQIMKPDLTDQQAKNVIINLANYVQLKDLTKRMKENKQTTSELREREKKILIKNARRFGCNGIGWLINRLNEEDTEDALTEKEVGEDGN